MNKPKDDAAPAKASTPSEPATPTPDAAPRKCGLVMPISAMGAIPASHWADVKAIITEALPSWQVNLVSDADDAGVIQLRIVGRLYSDEMVIADVSERNPNVMFELGMRLAFDKPTVIIKDEQTQIPFDISPTEYVLYPRDLRYRTMVDFQKRLAAKVEATMQPEHTTYLASFGTFKVPKIETEVVSSDQMILEKLGRVETLLARSAAREAPVSNSVFTTGPFAGQPVRIALNNSGEFQISRNQVKEVSGLMLGMGMPGDLIRSAAQIFLAENGPEFNAEILRPWCIVKGYLPG